MSLRSPWLARLAATALALACVARIPAAFCARRADAFFRGDPGEQRALARGARDWLEGNPEALPLHTGSPRFDGEWYLIAHMAAALGFAQTALEHPELRSEHALLVQRAIDRLLLPRGRAHDRDAWAEDPLAALDAPADRAHGHLAFLGYANLALAMQARLGASAGPTEGRERTQAPASAGPTEGRERTQAPASAGPTEGRERTQAPTSPAAPGNALGAAITEALARRFAASPTSLLESYPGETYPADNAAAVASIALHDRATGEDHRAVVERVLSAMRARYTDDASGLLYQRIDSTTGEPRDGARASGTAMAAFVLGYAGADAVRPWSEALAHQWRTVLGFGGVREYPAGAAGVGDVDSGPVLLGLGVSASALALAVARRDGDAVRYRSIFASAWLFGLPAEQGGALRFVAGGPLGDVLLFASLTASAGR
jgi:hypothetical protein